MYVHNGQTKDTEVGIQNTHAFKDHLRNKIRITFNGMYAMLPENEISSDISIASNETAQSHKPVNIFNYFMTITHYLVAKISYFFSSMMRAIGIDITF